MTAEEIIKRFDMVPLLPEGGYIRQTFLSGTNIGASALPEHYGRDKLFYSTILFLVTKNTFSRMHTLPTDEVYHFYSGDPVSQLQLAPDGTGKLITLGNDILRGEELQALVPAHYWQGTRLLPGGEWALLGTTMAPAYDDADYTDGVREELIKKYPRFENEIIERT